MASTTVTRSSPDEAAAASRLETTAAAVSGAAEAVVNVAGEAAARLPDVTAGARAAYEDARNRIQSSTDEMLTVGTAVSFGFAVGLLVGGAGRLPVVAAMVPVAMMGLTLMDRASQGRQATRGGQSGRAGA